VKEVGGEGGAYDGGLDGKQLEQIVDCALGGTLGGLVDLISARHGKVNDTTHDTHEPHDAYDTLYQQRTSGDERGSATGRSFAPPA
jgi:hypothetical protein